MEVAPASDVTRLLLEWSGGDEQALTKLMPLVYDELRRIAGHHLRRERAGHTLQPTAVVNEAYLRLVGQRRARWQNRAHFFAVAAQLIRRVLVDHARGRAAAKRGGGLPPLTLRSEQGPAVGRDLDVLALDETLTRLSRLDPRQARLVELRFFAGLSVEESAEAMGLSTATVKREWRTAKAWLYRELRATP